MSEHLNRLNVEEAKVFDEEFKKFCEAEREPSLSKKEIVEGNSLMCKNSYHKYVVYVTLKSEDAVDEVFAENAADEVFKVSVDGDDMHPSLAVVEIANHLRKIYSDEFEITFIKETWFVTKKQVNWVLDNEET